MAPRSSPRQSRHQLHRRPRQVRGAEETFASGPEVTKACLACHTEAAKQVQKTKHWTWEFMNPETQQRLGKKHIINNFCTAVPSNYEFCTACHVGYGWKDNNFDFAAQENVDCLVCHDTTGTYRKLPGLAGHPPYKDMEFPPHSGKIVKAPDLGQVARNVGKTSRANCGACHFYGGGGDAVKHGDLDSSMKQSGQVPGRAHGQGRPQLQLRHLPRHLRPRRARQPLRADGHGREGGRPHARQGRTPTRPPARPATARGRTRRHGQAQRPHRQDRLPDLPHPGIRPRRHPTKMSWDWSTAGKLDKDGKPFKLKDSAGHDAYDSKKGDFKYEDNVIPEYIWFNGKVNYTLRDTKLDPSQGHPHQHFEGSPDDGKSKIWPIKRVHRQAALRHGHQHPA
jgi:hypothetical protein